MQGAERDPASDQIQKANRKFSEYFHYLANEPSIGLYHVQEHVRKTIPRNSELKKDLKKKSQLLEEVTYDVDYSLSAVRGLVDLTTFTNIKALIEQSVATLHQMSHTATGSSLPVSPTITASSTPQTIEVMPGNQPIVAPVDTKPQKN